MKTTFTEIKIDSDESDATAPCYYVTMIDDDTVRISDYHNPETVLEIRADILEEIVRILPELEQVVPPLAEEVEVPF